MGYIDRIKFFFAPNKVAGIKIHNERHIEVFPSMVREQNHLKHTWNDVGYEIGKNRDGKEIQPIMITLNGSTQPGYVVHPAGCVCELEDDTIVHPVKINDNGTVSEDKSHVIKVHFEGVIGKLTSVDIIEKGLDLVGSNKKVVLGVVLGIILDWVIIHPILTAVIH